MPQIKNKKRRNKNLLLMFLMLGGIFGAPGIARAADFVWTGEAGTHDWFTALNWDVEAVPTSTKSIRIDTLFNAPILSSDTHTFESISLGVNADTSGLLTITGETTDIILTENISLGGNGTGTLILSSGATLSTADTYSYLGTNSSGNGTVIITGTGSSWTCAAVLFLGRNGTGLITLSDGGSLYVTGNNNTTIGSTNGSSGTLIVTGSGSFFSAEYRVLLGASGSGSLYILDGATATMGESLRLGNSSDGSGTLVVSGAGSKLEVTEYIYIAGGWNGAATGNMIISDGGSVSDAYAYIGSNVDTEGTVLVTGSGSTWTNAASLRVGRYGTGTLTISDGGYVSNTHSLIGERVGSKGSATVSGSGSRWISSSYIHIGDNGEGTLIISDGGYVECTYSRIGYASGSEGTVVVAGEGSSLVNTSTAYLGGIYIGRIGTGTLTISNGGLVSVIDNVEIAQTSESTGTLNIGSASGADAVAPGTISAASLTFGSGTGTLVFNHTSTSYTFDLAMSGSGSILVESGFTTLTADSSGFTGTTTVSGGTLSVNGSLGGTITVTSGGRLQGTGTMSTVVIESGGVFAPGNSVGTTTVASLTLESGSSLEIEIDGTGSDVINVTGTLTNNGGDVVITMDEDVSLSTSFSYDYLTYASLSGSAVSVTVEDSLPFLSTTASSTGTTTSVAFSRNGTSFASLASTDNQLKVASVLSGLTSGDLYQGLISVKNADLARASYDQLSGALHANVKLSLLADNKDEIFASRLEEAPSPYVQALGKWTRRDGHSQTSGFSGNSRGILIGQERQIDKDKIFGFAVHYQKANYEEEANLYADATVKSYGASLYGQMPYKYKTQLKAGLSYSYHDIESKREISISGYTDNPTGDYEAHKLETFIEAAKPYSWGDKGNIEPYGRLNLSYIAIPGFKETGGEAALDMQQSKDAIGKTTIGLRFKGELPFEKNKNNKAIFKANLGWEHIVGDLTTSSTGHLATLEDASISAAPLARDSVALGAQMQLHYGQSLNIGLRYAGTLAASSASHALVGSVGYRF